MDSKIKILLVDDHTLVQDGIASILHDADGIAVCGKCSSGEEAVALARSLSPDVVLMDIIMNGMTGIEAARWIKDMDNSIKVILLSTEVKKEFVSAGIKSGIDGYLPKDSTSHILLKAIHTVRNGDRYFTDAITKIVFEDYYSIVNGKRGHDHKTVKELSERENQILQLVAQGIGNKEISECLFISVRTVEAHKTHILTKLGLKNVSDLIKYAIKHNIISIE